MPGRIKHAIPHVPPSLNDRRLDHLHRGGNHAEGCPALGAALSETIEGADGSVESLYYAFGKSDL